MLRALFRVSQRAVRIQLEEASRSSTALTTRSLEQRRRPLPPAVGAIPGFWVEKPRQEVEKIGRGSVRAEAEVKHIQGEVVEVVQDEQSLQIDTASYSDTRRTEDTMIQQDAPMSQAAATSTAQSLQKDIPSIMETEVERPVPAVVAAPPLVEQPPAHGESSSSHPNSEAVEKRETTPVVMPITVKDPSGAKEVELKSTPLQPQSGKEVELEAETIPRTTADQPVEDKVPENTVQLDDVEQTLPQVILRPSKVPSSRLGRLFHYGSLVAGMSLGAAGEVVRRSTGQSRNGSVFMSEANIRRLVDKLSKMRGAALKLGQFMSIQDTNVLPEQLERVLQQVQANADYMPDWQLEKVMRAELGNDWESAFSDFPRVPIAAASIGQVHRATLAQNGMSVAVKVQFPGVEQSISSDLNNLTLLLRGSAVLPRGLFLTNTVKVFRSELADECDYEKEAEAGRRMKAYLRDEEFYEVPEVIDELSTRRVLTTEMMSGRPLSESKAFSQELRDKIGTAVLRLCLLELFRYRLMQTDPNWANFLWDQKKQKLQLIDFGATREYSTEFIDKWYRLLKSVIDNDREAMREYSLKVGYLTGEENEAMLEAHLRSMELLAVPFTEDTYDFSKQSVTDEVKKLIPTMLKYRLTPPPNETYSLNRKLSGSFLLCAKLGSRVNCRALWDDVVGDYKVTTET
ncbi:hypothetical protein QFC21_005819 [Naganishia friedmannii]|uniref:Uncharacterized protein n=1 Tax=Naganishia friedmannii TaxID=89922 RepID=A0ACC2V832_9TREE|nr:hypothetical protein QFC21_005819 [Naganishia friedmannii]